MKIVGISGSLRADSLTYKALALTMHKISAYVTEIEIIDLRDMHLPFCNGSADYPAFPDVARLRMAVKSSQGIILATPEYHGSISGVLKNSLDLLEFEHLEGKICGLIAVCGGVSSNNAINTLRLVCRSVHACAIPEQVIIAEANSAFDAEGRLHDAHVDKKLQEFAIRFVDYVNKLG